MRRGGGWRAAIPGLTLLAGTGLAGLAAADGVAVAGLLSDRELYRLATCGAPPAGACRTTAMRWTRPELTVTLAPDRAATTAAFDARLAAALRQALTEINAAGAGIRLRETRSPEADITIRPTILREGTVLGNRPGFSVAGVMGVGYMSVWSDPSGRIAEAVILISTRISDADLPSVLLEELFQALGFLYDVEGAAYEGVSILSQSSNATVRITGQDAALLRLHYPPLSPQDPP